MQLQIEYISPDKLTPYEENAKIHTPEQIECIAESIKAFGWKQPIVVDRDNTIIIGHGRYYAALELRCKTVPVVVADDMTPEQCAALRLADNKTNESPWDLDKLEEELAALSIAGIDMTAFGFDDLEDEFADAKKTVKEDTIPETSEEPNAKRGQIYQLGNHRLMCGDSTDENDITALMNGQKGRMLFTSPPYSDMREYEGGKDLSVDNLAQFIAKYRPHTDYQCVNLGIQRKNNDIFEYWNEYIRIARESGYKMLAWNVWDKGETGSIGNQSAFFPIRHEWIFVFGTNKYEINYTLPKKEESIIEKNDHCSIRGKDGITRKHDSGITNRPFKQMESVISLHPVKDNATRAMHPATFPVVLPSEYIKAMSDEGDIVIEPFGGSGTTLIACEQLGRQCRIMELEPKYVDVIIKRWEDFTGKKAELMT